VTPFRLSHRPTNRINHELTDFPVRQIYPSSDKPAIFWSTGEP